MYPTLEQGKKHKSSETAAEYDTQICCSLLPPAGQKESCKKANLAQRMRSIHSVPVIIWSPTTRRNGFY